MNKILQIITILLLIFSTSEAAAKINLFKTPRYIPALSFYGDSGVAYRLQEFKADMLIALVWSRTCGPCLQDLKHLGKFVEQTHDKGIEVILISPDKEWKTVDEKRAFLRRLGAGNMVSYNDRNSNFKAGMGISVTPTAILVNKEGEEIGQITGSVKWSEPEVIEYLLKLKDKSLQELNYGKTAD